MLLTKLAKRGGWKKWPVQRWKDECRAQAQRPTRSEPRSRCVSALVHLARIIRRMEAAFLRYLESTYSLLSVRCLCSMVLRYSQRILTVKSFAFIVFGRHYPCQHAAEITSLCDVSLVESKIHHQLVHNPGSSVQCHLGILA
jgi:hypothetical protein